MPFLLCGCTPEMEVPDSFRCVLERGLSGLQPAPEGDVRPAESAKAAAPEAAAQDLAAPYQFERAVMGETPRLQVFAGGQVTGDLEVDLARRPVARPGVPELPEKNQGEPEPQEDLPEASNAAALPPAAVEFQPLPEAPVTPAPERSLPDPEKGVKAPAAEPVQPLHLPRKDSNLAFRLLLRPEQPQQAIEAAPEAPPEGDQTFAAPRTPLRPENAFEPRYTEPPAHAAMTPERPKRPSNAGTPEITREIVPAPKPAAAVGLSREATAEAGDTARAQIKEARVPDLRVSQSEGEAGSPQEERGVPPAQPSRPHGTAAAHEGGAPPKDQRGTAPLASQADRTLLSQDRATPAVPARQVVVRVHRAGARPVEVGLVEKAGRVEVSVRSADAGLNHALRENLGDLVGRLREEGFEAAGWAPRETYGTERTEGTANEPDAAGERESARERFEQPGEQRPRKRPAEPWLEALDAESEKQGGKR